MGSQANWKEFTTEETTKERRRGRRARLVLPIEVSGIDEAEGIFCERTFTNDISEKGCSFHVSHSLEPGDMVAIKLLVGWWACSSFTAKTFGPPYFPRTTSQETWWSRPAP